MATRVGRKKIRAVQQMPNLMLLLTTRTIITIGDGNFGPFVQLLLSEMMMLITVLFVVIVVVVRTSRQVGYSCCYSGASCLKAVVVWARVSQVAVGGVYLLHLLLAA